MNIQEIIHRPDVVVALVVAVGGTAALFARYAKTLAPREGDKMDPKGSPERKALRPILENLMRARGIKPVNDKDLV